MKTSVLYFGLFCALVFFAGCSTSQRVSKSATVQRLLGLWEVKAVHNSDEEGYKEMPNGMFKMVFPDGRFMNFMSTNRGAIITVDGTYRMMGDSVYVEEIVNSFNKTQEGKDNLLWLKMSHDNFMYLRWFQPVDEFGVNRNRWVEEIWQRVLIEDLEVSNVDLRQELRQLISDEKVIEKVIN